MGNVLKECETLLNHIASQLPLVEKSDLAPLAKITSDLELICAEKKAPKAFATQASRALALTQHIIMDETPFDEGCKKLSECIEKMAKGLKTTSSNAKNEDESSQETDEKQSKSDSNELTDLLSKFASSQSSVLEDFEAYALELEKNDPLAKGAIKRILHTWKGEFGVLDLQEYSKFIHSIEDLLEADKCNADMLLKLKDLLASKFIQFSSGNATGLTEAEKNVVCETAETEAHVSPGAPSPAINPQPLHNQIIPEAAPPVRSIPVEQPLAPVVPVVHTETKDIQACDPSLMTDFINESREHLHTAETVLLELETDPSNKENLNTIFRAWHTIKGVAGFLGLKEIAILAHKMESRMDLARKGELVLDSGPIDIFLETNDCLKAFVDNVETAMKGSDYVVPEAFEPSMLKLSGPLSSGIASKPDHQAAPDKKVGEILVESGAASAQQVGMALQKQAEGDNRKIGEILLDEAVPARAVGNALAAQNMARKSIEETIRVPVNRIDQLVDSIGEAVIAQSMINASPLLMQVADQALHTKIAHANTILRQIQELAMSLRMVSIKSTFQKMARLARDLSKKCDRDINFVTEGEDTELDKSVVENIGDPLIHMIRNSIDHGIEPHEERAASGKPLRAMVKLRAFHRAGSIFIEVSDDGKGLDRDAIFAKGVSRGLCKEDSNLSEQEIFQFIFLPGFSTAKVVTDVSGRGVGMDVVRRNIEALRGSVEISSVKGQGTTFSIRLPLTLAIVDGMIVRSGEDKFILPTLAIIESLKPAPEQLQTVMGKGRLISVRGELITLVHLGGLLSRCAEKWDIATGIIMIVEDMLGKKLGLQLDEIIGQQQVVIKSLGEGMHDIPGVTGGAIMSDGAVSLILDVGAIVKLAGEGRREISHVEELQNVE